MNIVNPLGSIFQYGRTTNALADRDADAGDFSLKRPQKQTALIYDIKTCPIDGREAVPEQGRRVGKNRKLGGIGFCQRPQLFIHQFEIYHGIVLPYYKKLSELVQTLLYYR